MSNLISNKQLIDNISNNLTSKKINLTKSRIKAVLTEFLNQTKQVLIDNKSLNFRDYYTFTTVITKPRTARNLKTKEIINIPAQRAPKVRFSRKFKKELNQVQ